MTYPFLIVLPRMKYHLYFLKYKVKSQISLTCIFLMTEDDENFLKINLFILYPNHNFPFLFSPHSSPPSTLLLCLIRKVFFFKCLSFLYWEFYVLIHVPFLNCIICFLIYNFLITLYILDTTPIVNIEKVRFFYIL